MHLFKMYLQEQQEPMKDEGVRLETIGDLSRIPAFVQEELERTKKITADCKKIDLVLAINYGGRDDLKRAFVAMLQDVERGVLLKEEISEAVIARYLDTAGWPDPELFIRTSGEMRQSNFLLWQLCYSEFYYTDVLWPEFTPQDLLTSICKWQSRKRRLGV
jgi:undecaprenyl diphosphate synthase